MVSDIESLGGECESEAFRGQPAWQQPATAGPATVGPALLAPKPVPAPELKPRVLHQAAEHMQPPVESDAVEDQVSEVSQDELRKVALGRPDPRVGPQGIGSYTEAARMEAAPAPVSNGRATPAVPSSSRPAFGNTLKSAIRRSGSAPSRKTARIADKPCTVHHIAISAAERQERCIVCASRGHLMIKRTGTYGSLGLGFIVDRKRHEQELARRALLPRPATALDKDGGGGERLRFSDHYDVQEEICTGGFSSIHRAVSKSGKEVVAVKRVLRSIIEPCEAFEPFRTETTMFANLEHPNVLWRRHVFAEAEVIYLVMDLLTGATLFDRICSQGVLTSRLSFRYLYQMISGLAYCHTNRIMHRDIKPENYMLESVAPDAQLKLVDFGVSRIFESGQVLGTQVGTLAYTAPEVLEGRYNEKADVWSSGCTIFLCCAGSQPIMAFNDNLLMDSIRQAVIAWHEIEWMHHKLLMVVQSMLTKTPSKRPSSQELAANDWLRAAANAPPRCCGLV